MASDALSVTARIGSSPAAGVDVIIHDANGALLHRGKTGADGKVTAAVQETVTASLIFPAAEMPRAIVSFLDLGPGDSLDVTRPVARAPIVVGSAAISLPGSNPDSVRYDVTIGCLGGITTDPSQTTTFQLRDSCIHENRLDTLSLALSQGDEPLAYALATDVETNGGETPVGLSPWSTNWLDVNVRTINPPVAAYQVTSFVQLRKHGRGFPGPNLYTQSSPSASTTFAHSLPMGFGEDAVETRVRVHFGTEGAENSRATWVRRSPAPSDVEVDLSVEVAPPLSEITFESSGRRPRVTWQSQQDLGGMSAGRVHALWTVEDSQVEWQVVFPPEREAIEFPPLPDDVDLSAALAAPPQSATLLLVRCQVAGYRGFLVEYCPNIGFPGRDEVNGSVSWVIGSAALDP